MRLVTWNVNGLRPRVREAAPLADKPPTHGNDDSAAALIAAHVGGADLLALQEAKLTTTQLTKGSDADDPQFARRVCCLPRSGHDTEWSACLSLHSTRGYAGVTTYARAEPVRAAEGLTPHPPPSTCLATRPIAVPPDVYGVLPEGSKVWCGCSGIGPDGTPQAICPRLAALLQLDVTAIELSNDVNSEGRAVMSVHPIASVSSFPTQDCAPLPLAMTLFNLYAPNESRGDRLPFKLSFFTALHRAVVAAASSPAPPIVAGDLNLVASAADQASSQEWPDEVEQAALRALRGTSSTSCYGDEDNELDLAHCQCSTTCNGAHWCWCSIALTAYCAARTLPSRPPPSARPGKSSSSSTPPEPMSELDRFPSYIGSLLSRMWYHSITRGPEQLLVDLANQADGTPPRQPRFTCWSIKYDLRRSNYGCRLDYVLAHSSLARWAVAGENGVSAEVLNTSTGSDHAPVAVQFGFELASSDQALSSLAAQGDPWMAKDLSLLPCNWPTFQSRGTITSLFAQAAQKAVVTPSALSTTSQTTKPAFAPPPAPKPAKAKSSTTKQMSMKQFFGRPPPAPSRSQPKPSTPSTPIPSSSSASSFTDDPPLDPGLYESVPTKVDPDAQRAWSRLLQPRPPPKCWHGEAARQAKVSKPGKNKGRTFWFCARPLALGPGTIPSSNPPHAIQGDAAPQGKNGKNGSLDPTQCGFFRWG